MIENGASKRKTESKVDDDLKQSKREAAKRKRETLAKRIDDDLNLCNVKRFLSADSFVRHFVIICDVMRVFFVRSRCRVPVQPFQICIRKKNLIIIVIYLKKKLCPRCRAGCGDLRGSTEVRFFCQINNIKYEYITCILCRIAAHTH